jgi:hypothetical protein
VELALNLVWLLISAGLGLQLLAARRKSVPASGHSRPGWTLWTGYLVLVALLLPAISMSDDLLAMRAPAEGEQIVRRYDAPRPALTPIGHLHVLLHRMPRVLLEAPAFTAWLELAGPHAVPVSRTAHTLRSRAPPAAA